MLVFGIFTKNKKGLHGQFELCFPCAANSVVLGGEHVHTYETDRPNPLGQCNGEIEPCAMCRGEVRKPWIPEDANVQNDA
ncbi:hypothetical protein KAR91_80715 [Candidatus Pacearchaeota archaeon]|nr:hypothetical protein [Candidatus Pacearchaeota archaeon]